MYQVTPQVQYTRFGSGNVEISSDGTTWTSLGAANKIGFEEKYSVVDQYADNGGLVRSFVKDQKATLKLNLLEVNLAIQSQLRGGIDNYSQVAGTPVTGQTQVVMAGSWSYSKFIPLDHQGAVAPTVTAVNAATDGALVAGTDYTFGQDANGVYGIYVIDSTTVTTTNQNLTITYNYTPVAAKVLKSGGKTAISFVQARVTNTDDNGKKFRITIFKARNSDGIKIDLGADDDPKLWEIPVTLEGSKDPSRNAGEQLFMIEDEQSS